MIMKILPGSKDGDNRNLCIIPARGGSKRIPRKNIKEFVGRPIISYSIKAALDSMLFKEVMVSTEDEEIAEISQRYGAVVPFSRSLTNSSDYASTLDVVKEVLEGYSRRSVFFDRVCVLYPTAPFVTAKRLCEGYSKLDHYQAVMPIVQFDYPIWRSLKMENDHLKYQWPEFEMSRSQDLQIMYHDAGQWYWLRNEAILTSLVPQRTTAVVLHPLEAHDIDNQVDWVIAEQKFKLLHNESEL